MEIARANPMRPVVQMREVLRIHPGKRWLSMPDGEYRLCLRCLHVGYGVDSWHPATPEFWPVTYGKLKFRRCRACIADVAARRFGFVNLLPIAKDFKHELRAAA